METGARGISACVLLQTMLSASSDKAELRLPAKKPGALRLRPRFHPSGTGQQRSDQADQPRRPRHLRSLAPRSRTQPARPVRRLDVEGFPILRHGYAVYPAGRQLSVVARAFLDYLLGRGRRCRRWRASANSHWRARRHARSLGWPLEHGAITAHNRSTLWSD